LVVVYDDDRKASRTPPCRARAALCDHNHRQTTRDIATSATLPRTNCALREGVNTMLQTGARKRLVVIAVIMKISGREKLIQGCKTVTIAAVCW
jgi:hypothetical protein